MNIHIKSILGAIAFSLLFYSKSFGLNVVLISILVTIALSTSKNPDRFKWGYAIPYLFTALMVFIDPSGFHLFVHLVALLVLIGKSIAGKSSIYISAFTGLMNIAAATLVHFADAQNDSTKERKTLSPQVLNYLKGSLIALVLLGLFTLLYRNANPVFDRLISDIDFGFISLPWLLCTLLGYLLFLNMLRPFRPDELLVLDAQQRNELPEPEKPFSPTILSRLKGEHTIGSIVFIALNLLLVFFLITDLIYLLNPSVESNGEYSSAVHQGIYALLFSIIVAIGIILFFFRGDLNFYDGNKRLKLLTYTWIVLNSFLVGFTCYKNWAYVEALGLTYKRIGVFIYLFLTIIGLVTAYLKVFRIKSFVYLLRANIVVWFVFLILSTGVPWDRAITAYNLKYIENPDIPYLTQLGERNLDQMYSYAHTADNKLTPAQKSKVKVRYRKFLDLQEAKTWQEYTWYHFTENSER